MYRALEGGDGVEVPEGIEEEDIVGELFPGGGVGGSGFGETDEFLHVFHGGGWEEEGMEFDLVLVGDAGGDPGSQGSVDLIFLFAFYDPFPVVMVLQEVDKRGHDIVGDIFVVGVYLGPVVLGAVGLFLKIFRDDLDDVAEDVEVHMPPGDKLVLGKDVEGLIVFGPGDSGANLDFFVEGVVLVGGEPGFVRDDGFGGIGGGRGGEEGRRVGGGGDGTGLFAGEGGQGEEALHIDGEAEVDDDGFHVFALDHDIIFFEVVVDNAGFLHPFDGKEDLAVDLGEHALFEARGAMALTEEIMEVEEAESVDESHLGDDVFVWVFTKVLKVGVHMLGGEVSGEFFLVVLDFALSDVGWFLLIFLEKFAFGEFGFGFGECE